MLDLLVLNRYRSKCLNFEDVRKIYRKEKNVYNKLYEPTVNFKCTIVEFFYDEDIMSMYYGNDVGIYKIITLNINMIKLVPYIIDEFTSNHHYIIIRNNGNFILFLYYKDVNIFKNILEPIV